MAQRVKVLATPDNLSLIPGTHIKVVRREMIQKAASGPLYMCHSRHTYPFPNNKHVYM